MPFHFDITHGIWIIRILLSAFCGCLIGYERSNRNKGAGVRTHAILALGSALIMLVSKYGFLDVHTTDGSRLAAQIVSGVGFLGAGVIFVKNGNVLGLTTAAGMWATSGVGMCIGAGLYDIGIITTLILIGLQILFHKGFFLKTIQNSQNIQMEIIDKNNALKDIYKVFLKYDVYIQSMKVEQLESELIFLEIETTVHQNFQKEKLIAEMIKKPYLKMFNYC